MNAPSRLRNARCQRRGVNATARGSSSMSQRAKLCRVHFEMPATRHRAAGAFLVAQCPDEQHRHAVVGDQRTTHRAFVLPTRVLRVFGVGERDGARGEAARDERLRDSLTGHGIGCCGCVADEERRGPTRAPRRRPRRGWATP